MEVVSDKGLAWKGCCMLDRAAGQCVFRVPALPVPRRYPAPVAHFSSSTVLAEGLAASCSLWP